ncbi:uroporphyrinogen-III synthase [Taylorella equigenitalis]|uniref:uroporphyrinogen-III synthase n=1 Tax=Taylorella equigenitalis TaxID=29575 RepID=UPI0023B0A277|nr:uroporphyrinogen-III synthase [Taylorella equigenitalis]WEE01320.1 uroporphyrinogen-III synthase [Taylorella equigenitalis]WFD77857.1 uroporphyrinogen-III synthase [Taylorella equigenitalis]WFD79335.1 uroporphyrinogen-III synthase [Taylorella equigenitalis]WFD80811.1 uroporphyrinogen-III synthase [Taylorella equigenitalis]WFD82289.1 uroporphyrinogen-III synthase [Taylorella equigenitalis]
MLHLVLTSNSIRNRELSSLFGSFINANFHDLPALQIEKLPRPKLTFFKSQLPNLNYIFFVSRNAVDIFFQDFEDLVALLPSNIKFLCVGSSTAEQIRHYCQSFEIIFPDGNAQDSQALLQKLSPLLAYKAKFLIVKGEGGRGEFQDFLVRTGHEVFEICVYKRLCHKYTDSFLHELNLKHLDDDYVFVFTSTEGVKCLLPQIEKFLTKEILRKSLFLVIHDRLREIIEYPHCETIQLNKASFIEVIKHYFNKKYLL